MGQLMTVVRSLGPSTTCVRSRPVLKAAMLTCNPSPFEDPKPEVDTLLSDIAARINGETGLIELGATEYEKKMTHFSRFLAKNQYDVEITINQWKDWVKWRHGKILVKSLGFKSQENVIPIFCILST